jgi:hypothetical protein
MTSRRGSIAAGSFAARQRSGNETWVDPIIGLSGRVELGNRFALQAEGDVGGFGLVSDIDWQVLGTLQYEVADSITLDAGYRYLAVDYKNGGFLLDVAVRADCRRKHSLRPARGRSHKSEHSELRPSLLVSRSKADDIRILQHLSQASQQPTTMPFCERAKAA